MKNNIVTSNITLGNKNKLISCDPKCEVKQNKQLGNSKIFNVINENYPLPYYNHARNYT